MSKLDTQGLGTLVVEINKSLNTKINNSIDKIDLSPLATKTEVNELKSAVEGNNTTLTTSVEYLNTEVNKKFDKTGGQFEGTVKARSNAEYTTSQMRNIILSIEDPDIALGDNGDIWIKYK